jgi:hypothetical protein
MHVINIRVYVPYNRCLLGLCIAVALVRTDVSEKISSPSSEFHRLLGPHSCVTMEPLLISLSIEGYYVRSQNLFWDAFTAVSVIDFFWDFVPCGSS